MRLTFVFAARVFDRDSGADVSAPDSLDGWQPTKERMENYADAEIGESGVVGGEILVVANEGVARLQVIYWSSEAPTDELVERLRADTITQLEDGIGENGFEVDADGEHLVIVADTNSPIDTEIVDDGREIRSPSRIAIAARDGKLSALFEAIEADRDDVDGVFQGYSGLQLAILYGHPGAVAQLLAAGADPNQLDAQGSTPLQLCAVSNALDDEQSCVVARMLLGAGADAGPTSANGQSARMCAEAREKRQLASIL